MRRWRLPLRFGGGLLAAGAVFVAVVPSSLSGFAATVTNASAKYASGSMVLAATANSSTCTTSSSTTITTDANTNCAGTLFPTHLTTRNSSASITVSTTGNLTAGSVALSSQSSCGVLVGNDSSSAGTNDAYVTGGVTAANTAPYTGTTSLAFDGSSGYLQTEQSYANPQTYSISAWFETSSASSGGGSIIGFGSQQNTSPYNWDRQIWLNSSGDVVFGTYLNGTNELTSPSAYNDGNWHFVVATSSPAGSVLYVDGAQVAANTAYTGSQDYAGWWHIGWSDAGNWPTPPNQQFWNGDLSDVAIYPSVLSSSAVTTLYHAGAQTTEQTDVLADSPTVYWPLTSTPTDTSGVMENLGTTLPDLAGSNTATIEGQVTSLSTSSLTGGSSAEFESAQTGFLQTASSQANPQTFSIVGWFRTASGGDGTIVGFSNAQGASGSSADRSIWVDNSGQVVFGINDAGTQDEINSGSTNYANSGWHFVVATLSSSTGMKLYVDGSQVSSSSSATAAQSYTGYWHIGWGGNVSGSWANASSSPYFDGALGNVAIMPTVLSASAISTLYGETSQTSEQSQMNSDGATYYWPLLTAQTVSFCASESIYVTIENDSPAPVYCEDPYGSGACPSSGASTYLSALAGQSIPMTSIAPGSSDTIKITMADTTNAEDGMHFAIPLTISASAGGFTASLFYPASTPSQTFQS